MNFFRKLRINKQYSLVMDIGTSSVSVLLFEVDQSLLPKITLLFRRYQQPTLTRDTEKFQRDTLKSITDLFHEIAQKQKGCYFHDVVIGFSAPFYTARTMRLEKRFGTYRLIGEKDVLELFEEGKEKMIHDIGESDSYIFETTAMETMLNGYIVNDAIGRRAEALSVLVRYAALHKRFLDEIRKRIEIFGCDPRLRLYTFPTIYTQVLQEIFHKGGTQVLIDVGGEVTEITILKNGMMYQIFTAPFGIMEVFEEVKNQYGTNYDSAVSMVKAYIAGSVSSEKKQKIDEALSSVLNRWRVALNRVLEQIPAFPRTELSVYLLGGGAAFPRLKDELQTLPALKLVKHSVKIQCVLPQAFKEKVLGISLLAGSEDFGLLGLLLVLLKNNADFK